jgi:hypothetical protein
MVEIFKTNVTSRRLANKLLKILHANWSDYHFKFDLEDCDRILRAQSTGETIEEVSIIKIVKDQSIEICFFED